MAIQRLIEIKLKVTADAKAKAEIDKLKSLMVGAAGESQKAWSDSATAITESFQREADRRRSIFDKGSSVSATSSKIAIDTLGKQAPSSTSGQSVTGGSGATSADKQQAQAQKTIDSLDRLRSKALEKEYNERERASASLDRQRSKALEKEMNDQQRAADKLVTDQKKAMDSLDRQHSKAIEKEIRDQQKAVESLDRQRSKAYEKELNDQKKAADKLQSDQKKAMDSLDRQRSKAYEKELNDQKKANDKKLIAEQKAIEALDKQASKAYEKDLRDQQRANDRQVKEQERTQEKLVRAVESARDRQVTANKQVANAALGILDGSMEAAKGLAYLGMIGEKDAQKVLDGLLLIDGGFKTLRGGVGTFLAIRDAIEGSRKAALAHAAVNEILAASQAKNAAGGAVGSVVAGGVGQRVAATAGGRAVGSVAGGAIAGAAGGAGAVGAGMGLKTVGANATALLKPIAGFAGAAAGLSEVLQAGRRFMGENTKTTETWTARLIGLGRSANAADRATESNIVALWTWRKAAAESAKSTENLTKVEKDRQKRLQQTEERDQRITAVAGFQTAARDRREEDRLSISEAKYDPRRTALTDARDARARAGELAYDAENERTAAERRAADRKQSGASFSHADELQAVERLYQARERQKQAEKEINAALREQLNTQKQQTDAVRSSLDAAKDAVAAQRDQTKSRVAEFGKLSAGEQTRIVGIADKHKRGEELTRAEVDTLDQYGMGKGIVQDYYQQKGEKAGGQDALTSLGDRDAEMEAMGEVSRLEAKLEGSKREEQQTAREIRESAEAIKRLVESATEAFRTMQQSQARAQGIELPDGTEGTPVGGNVAFEVENSVERLGKTITSSLDQVNENVRRVQERIAASQIS